jgi:ABC-type maltose transport system permease subunit
MIKKILIFLFIIFIMFMLFVVTNTAEAETKSIGTYILTIPKNHVLKNMTITVDDKNNNGLFLSIYTESIDIKEYQAYLITNIQLPIGFFENKNDYNYIARIAKVINEGNEIKVERILDNVFF